MIEIENLEFSYDKTLPPVLRDISIKIERGSFVGIFGPNGGGKTTFLKLLMGFYKPSKGTILIGRQSPKAFRTKIGYVPQVTEIDRAFPITVLQLVLMGCLSRANWWGGFSHESKAKARKALADAGLADQAETPFGTLSGGQAQRALIARALVGEPQLLLLDEPTANVDPEAKKEIYRVLRDLKGKITILMVTHDLNEVQQYAERLLCINREVTPYLPKQLCEHFTLGLYHS